MALSSESETNKPSAAGSSSSNCKTDCRWLGCKDPGPFPTIEELVDHVRTRHLEQFTQSDFVVCLWEGCKVFNRPFERKDWLPQHMRRHTNERPHKCFMNGCNMSFWNVHALQSHLQLHFKPTASSKQKKTSSQKRSRQQPALANSLSAAGPEACCQSDGGSSASHSDKARKSSSRQLALKVRIPLNSSNASLSAVESRIPIPINGSTVHDDDIDLCTLSVMKKALLNHLLVLPKPTAKNTINLKGKVIGRRNVGNLEYLVRWCPMLVPDSWVSVSDYTGYRLVAVSELMQCQKSALVQHRFLTSVSSDGSDGSSTENLMKSVSRKRKRF